MEGKKTTLASRMAALLPAPVVDRLMRLRATANRRPKTTATLLLAFALVNFALLLMTGASNGTRAFEYPWKGRRSVEGMFKDKVLDQGHAPSIPYSLRNFLAMRSIRDSLELLRTKGFRSREDTLLFLRIMERYASLDTAFARQVAEAQSRDNPSANLKNTPK